MDETILKKIEPINIDERGEIWDLINEEVSHVGLVKCKKDCIRGNHYFKKSKRNLFVLSGKFELFLAKAESPEKIEKKILSAGDFIEIPAGMIHTFRALEDSVMIGMDTLSRVGKGYENDVVRVKIV